MAILVTGGAGFIGSHTSVELLNKGKEIVIIKDIFSLRYLENQTTNRHKEHETNNAYCND